MKKTFSLPQFLTLVFLLPFVAYGTMVWYKNKFQKIPFYGAEETEGGKKSIHSIASFKLVNQEGLKVGSDDWKGKVVVVDFFFTHCPSICPKMTASLKRVQQAFANDDKLIINSISVDPEHDSVPQLKRYISRFGKNTKNGDEDFIHSEKLVLADQQKRIRGYYDGTNKQEVDQLIHDIKKLKYE